MSKVISESEFIARMTVDPNYVDIIHVNNLRVMVLKDFVQNLLNNEIADLVMFIKNGLASILKYNMGPNWFRLRSRVL